MDPEKPIIVGPGAYEEARKRANVYEHRGVAMNHYRGWNYDYSESRPVTGRWRATRFGVGMCNHTEEGLRAMIDVRVSESEPWCNCCNQQHSNSYTCDAIRQMRNDRI